MAERQPESHPVQEEGKGLIGTIKVRGQSPCQCACLRWRLWHLPTGCLGTPGPVQPLHAPVPGPGLHPRLQPTLAALPAPTASLPQDKLGLGGADKPAPAGTTTTEHASAEETLKERAEVRGPTTPVAAKPAAAAGPGDTCAASQVGEGGRFCLHASSCVSVQSVQQGWRLTDGC